MNAFQNSDTRSIETFVAKKHPGIRDEMASGLSCDPNEGTSPAHNVLEVLVIDGSHENGKANVELIRRLGHTVKLAGDGYEGLRMAAAIRPDVVLLNIDLPSLDGYQVAKRLRVAFPTKNALITGVAKNAHKPLRQRCVQAGIDLVIEAPIDGNVIEILLLLECVRLNRLINADLIQQAKNDFRNVNTRDPSSSWRARFSLRDQGVENRAQDSRDHAKL